MSEIDELLERAGAGDLEARSGLLNSQTEDLLRFVTGRLNKSLAARVDPADIVQEVLMEASRRLDHYLATRPMPFSAWMLQIANDAVIDTHRRHTNQKRNVDLEIHPPATGDGPVAGDVISQIIAPGKSPSSLVGRNELREKLRAMIATLPISDQQILQMRFIEERSIREIADELGITEDAVRMRQLRSVARLRELLDQDFG